MNLDVPLMASTVFGALPEILALLPEIAEQLPKLDLQPIRNLESYAMALSHGNTLHMMAVQPMDFMRGPMTRGEIRAALEVREGSASARGI